MELTKPDVQKFIVALEAKNSWDKNEVIDLFKEWLIETLMTK